MARIAGVLLPNEKRTIIGITYVYGIGSTTAEKIIAEAKVSPDKRIKDLTHEEENRLNEVIRRHTVEGDLRRETQQNIKRLQDINSYRGNRHRRHLPARGQRTKTNARTRRGRKITMGSGRRKESKT